MNTVKLSLNLEKWLAGLRDRKGKAIILGRIKRAVYGNLGDVINLGDGLWEMRIHFGPGYWLYYAHASNTIYFFLAGGDKSTHRAASGHACFYQLNHMKNILKDAHDKEPARGI